MISLRPLEEVNFLLGHGSFMYYVQLTLRSPVGLWHLSLCKIMMAAACVRTLSKVGRLVLDTQTSAALAPRISMRCQRRAYGTGGAGFRSRLSLAAPVRASGTVLGCAFLLGGGFGLYQTLKLTLQRHLAEEKANVSIQFLQYFWMKVLKCALIFGFVCILWFY